MSADIKVMNKVGASKCFRVRKGQSCRFILNSLHFITLIGGMGEGSGGAECGYGNGSGLIRKGRGSRFFISARRARKMSN